MSGVKRLHLRVQLDGIDEPVSVITDMRDMSEWEKASHAKDWPTMSAAPILALRYTAWAALRRLQHPGTPATWDDDWIVAVEPVGGEPERPTLPGPGPG